MGIIGNTQGVSNAMSPPPKPTRNIQSRLPLCSSGWDDVSHEAPSEVLSNMYFATGWLGLVRVCVGIEVVGVGFSAMASCLPVARLKVNFSSAGGRQVDSLQAMYSRVPLTGLLRSLIFTFWVKVAVLLKSTTFMLLKEGSLCSLRLGLVSVGLPISSMLGSLSKFSVVGMGPSPLRNWE